jgi:S-adenosylmethionine hydrolase
VLTFVLEDGCRAWEITSPGVILPSPGATFHGRDIFSPAAAHAAAGVPLPEFGAPVPELERLPLPVLESPAPGVLSGQTLHADRFGNVLTSLGVFRRAGGELAFTPWVGDAPQFTVSPANLRLQLPDGRELPWAHTFAEIPDGECAVILGSSGLLEIVANRRSAAQLLGLAGDERMVLFSNR